MPNQLLRLYSKMFPSTSEEKSDMNGIPYSSAIESLMYAMVSTCLDLAHAVGFVSGFTSNPTKTHRQAVQWIFRYLRDSSSHVLCFNYKTPYICRYADSNMVGDLDKRRSTKGYVFTFAGAAIS